MRGVLGRWSGFVASQGQKSYLCRVSEVAMGIVSVLWGLQMPMAVVTTVGVRRSKTLREDAV